METDGKPELGVVPGGRGEVGDSSSSEKVPERYPDYSFDLSEGHLVGNGVVFVQPHRRLIRVVNELATALPDHIPHITAKDHVLNHLKRERAAIARGVRPAPDIQVTDEMRKENHPIAQLFDGLDENYTHDDRIATGELRALKEDVLIITEHMASELFVRKQLGRTALDTPPETE